MKRVAHAIRALGHFWWDFLIGDTPELFVAVLVVVGLAILFHRERALAIVLLPVVTVAALATSTLRTRIRRSNVPPPTSEEGA